jgi:hypothetical protein
MKEFARRFSGLLKPGRQMHRPDWDLMIDITDVWTVQPIELC